MKPSPAPARSGSANGEPVGGPPGARCAHVAIGFFCQPGATRPSAARPAGNWPTDDEG